MISIILKKGREDSVLRRHPWLFSGAIARIEGAPEPGATVRIVTHDGMVCGHGAFSPHSQIVVRIWTFDPEEHVSPSFFQKRLIRAIESRYPGSKEPDCDAARLVFSESDGLPGLIVDRYGGYLVCQFLSTGAEYWKDTIISVLNQLLPNKGIFERSDVAIRSKEGLPLRTGVLSGQVPPDFVETRDGDYCFLVDIKNGHKTGFYLDQRDNRRRAAAAMSRGEVLDCFAYTGGFSVAAMKGDAASVTLVDSAASALALAKRNLEANNVDTARVNFEEGDVFAILRLYRDAGRQFDGIILDPPKFAHSGRDVDRAGRGYKDINLQACKLLRPGGTLVTFSCSERISPELFQKFIAYAALDARREVQILQWLHQAPDHPTAVNFPKASYLKGLICRVW